ncbi:Non-structural protein NSP1 like [uncultured Mediterranean phage uvMED]|jgi:hypothetical protein|nr:Non-structural protein NSP1 like [uncultured Mediterranean phage uvMED]BAR17804.1 Non-structural protein NSP1 like [uncultured Mediterranean phage uvMED]
MADSQATNVIDAGNLIKGLMTNNESAPVETAPTEVSEEPTETVETEEEGLLTEETESPNETESYEAEETSESSDIQENSEEPMYTVTIDGTDLSVNLEELIQGYQRNADYTRKTQELAQERNQSSEFVERSKKDVEAKLTKLNELNNAAQAQLQQEYAEVDFEKLYEEDPVEAARLEHKMRKKHEQLAQVSQQTQELQAQEFNKYLGEQQKLLSQKVPELMDEQKGPRFKQQMRDYLGNIGFNDNEINSVYDHRYVMLVKDAMNYRNLQKAKPGIKKKVANAPKVVKGGVAKSKGQVNAEARRQQLSKLRKTGQVRDAAKFFRNLI